MGLYLDKVKMLLKKFENMKSNISPDENNHADTLARIASNMITPSIIDARENWTDKIIDYIRNEKLPEVNNMARMIIQKMSRYIVVGTKFMHIRIRRQKPSRISP